MHAPVPAPSARAAGRDHAFHELQVRQVVRETDDASSFVLDIPEELRDAFVYRAGQFCTFRVRIDGQAHLRSYSMSSSPDVDGDFRITVKRVPGGLVSNWLLDHLEPGGTVEATCPAGVFCLGGGDGDVVALAAGSGITPVYSVVKTALATTSRRVRLLYANRDRDAAIFGDDLERLAAQHPGRLELVHHLDVERGFLDAAAAEAFLGDAGGAEVFVCGPAPFMDIAERAVLARGADPGAIRVERFTPPPEPPAPPAAGGDGIEVTVEVNGKRAATQHRSGTTILQTARQLGLNPPYSCESGSCATCMAKVVDGLVSMHVNHALTDDEVAEGWVLTCQAVPVSPSVHVVYGED